MLGIGFGFELESAWHWTRVRMTGDLALDSGRLGIGLGFGLESAFHWTWL